jgi:transposase-like protein
MTGTTSTIQSVINNFVAQLVQAISLTIIDSLTDACGLGDRMPPEQERQILDSPEEETPSAAPSRKPMTISPERRRALQLHGQYLGTLRGLSQKNRAAVKKVAKEHGVRAAIKAAKSLREGKNSKPAKANKPNKTDKPDKTSKSKKSGKPNKTSKANEAGETVK